MRRPITVTHPVVVNDGKPFDVNEQDVPIYTVQADCPLALKVLLQFNEEGD